jgi:hypothetical protein
MIRRLLPIAALAAAALWPTSADAAPRWVDRGITLPRHDFAFDVGLGIATARRSPPLLPGSPFSRAYFGPGMNLEFAFSVIEHLELGFRTGLRFGTAGRNAQADFYGRTLFTETWGTRYDAVANPEFKIRWAAYSGDVFEIGLDGRVFLPIETGSRIGMMFGVPMAFHIGHVVRLDTGVYVPVVFYTPSGNEFSAVSFPLNVWIQASHRFWVGPMSSLRFIDYGPPGREPELLLGAGGGYQVTNAIDLKAMFLFPRINVDEGARDFGLGFGAQFRIE